MSRITDVIAANTGIATHAEMLLLLKSVGTAENWVDDLPESGATEAFDLPFLQGNYEMPTGTSRSQPMRELAPEVGWTSTRSAPPVSRVGRTSQVQKDYRPMDGRHAAPTACSHIWLEHDVDKQVRLPKAMLKDLITTGIRLDYI